MTLFKNDDNSVPSVKAVADYVGSNVSGAMDFSVVKDTSVSVGATALSVTNETNGLCAVRVTKMSDGSTQYQSAMALGRPSNQTTAFIFNITASENYMIEAWIFNSGANKLVPAAVKYV